MTAIVEVAAYRNYGTSLLRIETSQLKGFMVNNYQCRLYSFQGLLIQEEADLKTPIKVRKIRHSGILATSSLLLGISHSSSSLSFKCAMRENGCRIGYEPTKNELRSLSAVDI